MKVLALLFAACVLLAACDTSTQVGMTPTGEEILEIECPRGITLLGTGKQRCRQLFRGACGKKKAQVISTRVKNLQFIDRRSGRDAGGIIYDVYSVVCR